MQKLRELLEEAKNVLEKGNKECGISEFIYSGIQEEIFSEMKMNIREAGGKVHQCEINESGRYIDFDIKIKKNKKVLTKLEKLGFSVNSDDDEYDIAYLTISY